ncbi:MAG: hypothetical protein KGI70_01050 [Patescibacteria group bacterium]|nr:hypothetical protein [Patescibacteria group bacterium]
MRILRTIGITLLVFVLSTALDAGVLYWAGTTPQGQRMLRDFLVAHYQAPQAPASIPQATSSQQAYFPIPKEDATEDYYLAFNNVLRDTYQLNDVNTQLGPVLDQLNQLTLSCRYTDFYDLITEARQLANRNSTLAAQFNLHISALGEANVKTSDALIKSTTNSTVTAGQALGGALTTYAAAIQDLLYGDTPTSAQLSDIQNKVAALEGASQNFADALKPLLQRIGDEIKRLTATSTPATH